MTAEEAINERSLRRLTNFLIDGGVHGLFVAGSHAESWALTPDGKHRVWETVVEERCGCVLVRAGTAALTTRETLQLMRLAEKAGVDAPSFLTPYFARPNEDEIIQHYQEIAESTRLPLVASPIRYGPASASRPACWAAGGDSGDRWD
jgi:4-hydroxy-tetrahydrodipicolinate synthase